MAMRVVLLVTVMVGFTAGSLECATKYVQGRWISIEPILNKTFYNSDNETRQLIVTLKNDCKNEILNKYLNETKMIMNMTKKLIKHKHNGLHIWKVKPVFGCILKKIYVDNIDAFRAKNKAVNQRMYTKFVECVKKHNDLAKGDYDALGNSLDKGDWCGETSENKPFPTCSLFKHFRYEIYIEEFANTNASRGQ